MYEEIILAECILNILSLVQAGIKNVQALYGANGFTEEHLQILKADRVKTNEYLHRHGTLARGSKHTYSLTADGDIYLLNLSMVPSPEELVTRISEKNS